jgi:hypothetical protein
MIADSHFIFYYSSQIEKNLKFRVINNPHSLWNEDNF